MHLGNLLVNVQSIQIGHSSKNACNQLQCGTLWNKVDVKEEGEMWERGMQHFGALVNTKSTSRNRRVQFSETPKLSTAYDASMIECLSKNNPNAPKKGYNVTDIISIVKVSTKLFLP